MLEVVGELQLNKSKNILNPKKTKFIPSLKGRVFFGV
jgi:hypothetical protein